MTKVAHSSLVWIVLVVVAALAGIFVRVDLLASGTSPRIPGVPAYERAPGLAERDCHDGIDNDADGLPDCLDPDCSARRTCRSRFLNEHTIENAYASFRFVRTANGLELASFENRTTGRVFTLEPGPLWTVTLRAIDGTELEVSPSAYPSTFVFDWREGVGGKQTLTLYWHDLQVDAQTRLDVTAHYKLPVGSGLLRSRLDVVGELTGRSILHTEFPRYDLTKLDIGTPNQLLVPSRKSGGGLVANPETTIASYAFPSPTHYQMGLAAYYNPELGEGIYYGCRDSDVWFKRYRLEGRGSSLYLGMLNLPENNLTTTSYTQPYPQVIGPFTGDWFDAATIYREWALQQHWVPERWETRADIPESLRFQKLNLFLKSEIETVPAQDFVDIVTAYRDRFGLTSIQTLLRGWDTTGDATGRYAPDFFPPKDGFRETIDALHAIPDIDVMVTAGTGSLEFDPRTPSYTADGAEDFALKYVDQTPVIRGPYVRMDFCTEYWRQRHDEIRLTNLQGTYDIDGTYFDAFVYTHECYDPDHGHPVGGGTYLYDCTHEWLESLLATGRSTDPRFFLGEEPPVEVFLDVIQFREGYYCVATIGQENESFVPLHQVVYHEVAPALISSKVREENLDAAIYTPLQADLLQAHGFSIGSRLNAIEVVTTAGEGLPGWLLGRPELAGHFVYLEALAHASDFARKYVAYGRMMRPLDATVDIVPTGLGSACVALDELPVIVSSVWRASDGRTGLVFTNWTDTPQSISYLFEYADYEIATGTSLELVHLTGSGATPITTVTGDFSRTESLDPKEVLVLELR